jgi:hypothetical protein
MAVGVPTHEKDLSISAAELSSKGHLIGPGGRMGTRESELRQLKEVVIEASRALACLDARRLEELALSCHELQWDLHSRSELNHISLEHQARSAAGEMATFARVLEVTRANLDVLNRISELRAGRYAYTGTQCRKSLQAESEHGEH